MTVTELRPIDPDGRADLLDVSAAPSTANKFVFHALRDSILRGTLPAGARIVQTHVADQLGVSTTPVREAIRDLVGTGLVRSDVRRGAVVHALSTDELPEVYEIRKTLESSIIDKVLENITDDEIAEAEGVLDEMDRTVAPEVWGTLNRRFHGLLTRAARSPRLEDMVQSVADLATLSEVDAVRDRPSLTIEADREHRELIVAIRTRRADEAREIVRRHLDGALAAVLSTREEALGRVAS